MSFFTRDTPGRIVVDCMAPLQGESFLDGRPPLESLPVLGLREASDAVTLVEQRCRVRAGGQMPLPLDS